MNDSDVRLDGVPENLRGPARALLECLHSVAGDGLRSHAVFGRGLVEEPGRRRVALESVAVLSQVDLDLIRRLATEGHKLGRLHVRAPLLMTPEYIRSSCDSFPIELLEIRQLHVTIFGDEYFSDLRFEQRDMRVQCEREIKRAMLHVRQGLLASGGKDRGLPELTEAVTEQTLRVLRAVLWLWDRPCPSRGAEIVAAAEQAGGLVLGGLRRELAGTGESAYGTLAGVYRDLEALSGRVNEIAVR